MNKKIYKNACIDGKITDITVEGGKFISFDKSDCDGIDLNGKKVFAGLIDIHTHGCIGFDTMDGQLDEMSEFHASNGVTSWLPTTMTADIEVLKKLTDIDVSKIKGANVLGFHLEGPYISEKYKGAQNAKYIQNPDYKKFNQLHNAKIVTIAPELEGSMEFIKKCDCVVALGHTSTDYDTAIEAMENGANCLTHVFNAMPPLHHRNPSVIGAAVQKNAYVQAICDGIHLHPAIIMTLYKLFGTDRMILISDSMRATGYKDGEYEFGGQQVFVKGSEARLADGTLAGSVSTLLNCVKCAIKFGIPESDAFKMASETPAKLLGIPKGELKIGYDAYFIVIDDDYNVIQTVIDSKN